MIALQNILNQLDELSLQQQPYSDHYALKYDENTRMHYSALFLMALLQEGAIAEQQHRMLESWLPAINLAGRQVELCEMAARLAKSGLAEAIKLVQKEEQLANALLLDMMIFSRVAKPLSDSTIQLLEALASFFKLTERNVADIVYFAAFILGLNVDKLERPNADLSLDAYSVYSEFLYDLPTSREKRLFAWVREKELSNVIPCYSHSLAEVSKLMLNSSHFPLPEEVDLLVNVKNIFISLSQRLFDENSLQNLKFLKRTKILQINTTSFTVSGQNLFRTLPNDILHLNQLSEIRIGDGESNTPSRIDVTFDYISDEMKNFIKNNNIHIVTPSATIKNFFQ